MNDVKCQAEHEVKEDGSYECYTCFGYGYAFVVANCVKCGRQYLTSPDSLSICPGKEFCSSDGLHLVYRDLGGAECFVHEAACTELPRALKALDAAVGVLEFYATCSHTECDDEGLAAIAALLEVDDIMEGKKE